MSTPPKFDNDFNKNMSTVWKALGYISIILLSAFFIACYCYKDQL